MISQSSKARHNMIDGQIRPNKVVAPELIGRFESVPRDLFVPADRNALAYVDDEVPLGGGRYLLEPMLQARMIQALEISPASRVLDVACATGYSTAIIAGLAQDVVATDPDAGLIEQAKTHLAGLGLRNVSFVSAPVSTGAPESGPYDAILINGAVGELPQTLAAQLKEGGRVVLGKLLSDGFASVGQLWRYEKRDGVLMGRVLMDASCRYLPDCAPQLAFKL